MFFIKDLSHTIQLHPSFFGPSTLSYLTSKLHQDVEGTCSGTHGFVIAVVKIVSHGLGQILLSTGMAEFQVRYRAIVYKPFKGETVDCRVRDAGVNKHGFFAEAGPLTVFVSTHLIPPDLKFDPNSNPPAFAADQDRAAIRPGGQVRVKIVGTRVDATEIFAIGTIKEDFLGPVL